MTATAPITYTLAELIADIGPRPIDMRPIPTPPEAQTLAHGCGCITVRRSGRLTVYRPFLTNHARVQELSELHAGVVRWLEDARFDDPERPAMIAHLKRLRWQRVQVLERCV
ncbi:hypothetical protein DESA109040_13835 [Deinococcus saxicola]|uniref:hypothetical protein n=1 Tax=Deinococcus saxicola TaxID=249406 RepID=UPI0039F0400A